MKSSQYLSLLLEYLFPGIGVIDALVHNTDRLVPLEERQPVVLTICQLLAVPTHASHPAELLRYYQRYELV